MESNQSPKIAVYQQRDFGEKITATFLFVRENWKPLLKYVTVFMLPVSILQGFFTKTTMDESVIREATSGADLATFFASYVGILLCSALGGLVFYALFYALLAAYDRREERLAGVTWSDLSPDFFVFLKRGLAMIGFMLLLIVVFSFAIGLLAVALPATLVVTLPGLLACAVPLSLFTAAYFLDNGSRGLWGSFTWSMRNGFRFWGGTFLVVLVCYLLTSIVSGVFSVPWYITYFLRVLLPDLNGETVVQGGDAINILQYLFGVVMVYGSYLASVVLLLGLTYQYGHISEKVDAVTVTDDIKNFDNL